MEILSFWNRWTVNRQSNSNRYVKIRFYYDTIRIPWSPSPPRNRNPVFFAFRAHTLPTILDGAPRVKFSRSERTHHAWFQSRPVRDRIIVDAIRYNFSRQVAYLCARPVVSTWPNDVCDVHTHTDLFTHCKNESMKLLLPDRVRRNHQSTAERGGSPCTVTSRLSPPLAVTLRRHDDRQHRIGLRMVHRP